MFHWFTGLFFFQYFLNLSKYCVKPIYMYMVLMEAYVFGFFLLVFFFNNFFFCVCVLYCTKISVPNIHEVGQFFSQNTFPKIHILTKSMCYWIYNS